MKRTMWVRLRALGLILIITAFPLLGGADGSSPQSSITILCYMNGDNDLSEEVLHTLDMMETVGSSRQVNVIVLVDGHPQWLGGYHDQWSQTRLMRLTADAAIGEINSQLLENWGEVNMGSPETLERFVRHAISLYPADRYLFYTFAHSKGVIDTGALTCDLPGKSLAISRDDSSRAKMRLDQFHAAIRSGLDGERFEMMVLFSCLSNMVEVGYAFSDITRYLVGSEDEIRLLNRPPGRFQVRGLKFETLIAKLKQDPALNAHDMGRILVDSHIQDYNRDVILFTGDQEPAVCRFSAGMAFIDTMALPGLVERLNRLAQLLIERVQEPGVAAALGSALSTSQQFASFLNLEYYDLRDVIRHLLQGLEDPDLRTACDRILEELRRRIILYERHTADSRAAGISIYMSNPLVPQNIFEAHQAMYRLTIFSRDTQWDEMIEVFRRQWQAQPVADRS